MSSGSFLVGLLGHGIGPSLSPALHMAEARALGLDYHYEVIDLSDRPDVDLGRELERLEEAGYDAVNVTHPFKREVLAHVGRLSAVVERIGSANLVLLTGERTAHNTDYRGFRVALEHFLVGRPRGRVLQVGAGGAGLATACALVDMGFDHLVVHDHDQGAARSLAERFGGGTTSLACTEGDLGGYLPEVEGVVHATPMGMREHPGVALDVELLDAAAWVAEVVYRPLQTELVRRSRARGLTTADGGAMAVGQALESLRLITGASPDVDRMSARFAELAAVHDQEE